MIECDLWEQLITLLQGNFFKKISLNLKTMVSTVTLISFLIVTANSQNIEWFKLTQNHQNNMQALLGPWSKCPDWDATIGLSYT